MAKRQITESQFIQALTPLGRGLLQEVGGSVSELFKRGIFKADPDVEIIPDKSPESITGNIATTPTGAKVDLATGKLLSEPITPASLQPAQPLEVAQPQPTPVFPVTSLTSELPKLELTQPEQEASDINKQIRDLTQRLTGQSTFRTEQEATAGISELRKTQTDLAGQLKLLQAEAQAIPLQIQQESIGRGRTAGGVAPLESARLRENAIKALTTGALLQASQGQLSTALELVDRAVAQRFDPIREEIAVRQANLGLILQSPEFSVAEKNRAQRQLQLERDRQRTIEQQESQEKAKQKKILEYAPVADATTLRQMQQAKDEFGVVQIANQKGIQTLEERSQFAKIAKDEAEAAKTIAEASGAGAGMDPAQLVAYAQQYASTGKIPTGLPKGTFGVVAQFAKQMPKQPGTIVDVNTGTKPDISDAKVDGFAALYDITKKVAELKELDKQRIKGVVAGTLGKIFGSAAQQRYVDLRQEIVDLLARARTGAALTIQEEKFYASQLPGRLTQAFFLGPSSQLRLDNFASKIQGTLDTKLKANGASIVGYSKVNLGGQDYAVGDVIEINGIKGRVLADGSIVEIE